MPEASKPMQAFMDYPCSRCKEPFKSCLCEPAKCGRGDPDIGCGADIWFVKTPRGKSMPLNRDGTSHHVTCPRVDDFREKKA